jgi:hypothetical protein
MTYDNSKSSPLSLFTNNFQIKRSLALPIMDNGSQKNLVSQELVQHLQIPTTPHPKSYQLGWVQKDGPASWYLNIVLSLFSIGQFKFFLCDVSPLDCVNLLLGLPYQQDRNVVYLAKTHQYKLSKYGHTYILTAAPTPTHHTKRDQSPCPSKPMCFSLSGMPYSTKQYRTPSTTIHGSLVPRIR